MEMILMKQNDSNKKVLSIVFIFVGIMFFMPIGMMTVFQGFSLFALFPPVTFAIVGLLAFYIIKKSSKNIRSNNTMNYNNTADRHCTSCHESIPVNSEYCPYCGLEQTEFVVCDYCGTQNSRHDLMCTNCNGLLK